MADEVDRRLVELGQAAADEVTEHLDVEAELADLHRRSSTTSSVGDRRARRWLIVAAASIVAVGAAALLVVAERADDQDAAPARSTLPPITTAPAVETTLPETPATTAAPVTETAVAAPPDEQSEQVGGEITTCERDPLTPPSLVDRSPPGEAVIADTGDGRIARWGDLDSTFAVSQVLDAPVDASWLDTAIDTERAITVGQWQATSIPVSDPPLGSITIYLRNTTDGCLRAYFVGPGLFVDQAEAVATSWVESLAAEQPVPGPGHDDLGADYFGRRVRPLDTPSFAIDALSGTGITEDTLTNEQLEPLFDDGRLGDGTGIRLTGTPSENRCVNRPIARSNGPSSQDTAFALSEARSIATAGDILLATRDVCPSGTRWGDPGTFSELVSVDTSDDAATVVSRRTWESDPEQIVFEDAARVIALGERTLADTSPDGRYVAIREQYDGDAARWEVLDLDEGAMSLSTPTACDGAGDVVGPPRFVGDGIVVIARACDTAAGAAEGQPVGVQVDAIDLSTSDPAGQVVWSATPPGLGVDGFTRSVDVSARRDATGTIQVIITGNGDLDRAGASFALQDQSVIELTRPGYVLFAFEPEELITRFDTPA